MTKEEQRIISLKDHRLQKQFSRALETMDQRMIWWQRLVREGDYYITVDENGMVYGLIKRFITTGPERRVSGAPMMAEARQWTELRPEGWDEDIFTAQVWGLLSKEQFQRAERLGWPGARGRFLDEVVTEDPRYTIRYTYADYISPEDREE